MKYSKKLLKIQDALYYIDESFKELMESMEHLHKQITTIHELTSESEESETLEHLNNEDILD